jgi:tetratricopeptide (TPR) repeat protein
MREKLAESYPNLPVYLLALGYNRLSLGKLLLKTNQADEAERIYHADIEALEKFGRERPSEVQYLETLVQHQSEAAAELAAAGRQVLAEEYRGKAAANRKVLENLRMDVAKANEDARVQTELGMNCRRSGDSARSEAAFRKADELLSALTRQRPDSIEHWLALAHVNHNLGLTLNDLRKVDEAVKKLSAALKIREELSSKFPDNDGYRQDIANTCTDLGWVASGTGDLKKAEEWFRRSYTLGEKLSASHPNNLFYQANWTNAQFALSHLYLRQRRDAEAEEVLRSECRNRERIAKDHPDDPSYRKEWAAARTRLGKVLENADQLPDAEKHLRETIEIWSKLADTPFANESRSNTAICQLSLAKILTRTGKSSEAAAFFKSADGASEKLIADFPASVPARLFRARVCAWASSTRPQEKDRLAGEAVEQLQKAISSGFSDTQSLQADRDFDSIRHRDDYKKLVAAPEKK